ncbi:hypothetical protein [Marinobacter litoralis]|uniref:hypothetical protein n=1 Tax=Marinobacter litoralis TaxID=187981 RepID=UPI0018ECEBC6|nr:hypothetical protein [Marinobacter litoralis]MBJ6137492.1 hypothetical protein [Marinobacter litoralis]
MHGKNLFIAWMLTALCMPLPSQATEPPGELEIAVITDVPITAATTELLQQAYQRLGVTMKTLNAPSRRALMMADKGLLDGDLFRIARVAYDYPNLVRVEYPLLQGELRAVVRPGDGNLLDSPKSTPIKAAVRLGIIIAEQTAKTMGMKPVQANSYEQARTLLESGRVDIALVSDIEGFGPLARSSWQEFELLPEPLATFTLYHYLNRRHENVARALPAILTDLEEEGLKTEILSKFREKQREWRSEDYVTENPGNDSTPPASPSLLKRLLYFL